MNKELLLILASPGPASEVAAKLAGALRGKAEDEIADSIQIALGTGLLNGERAKELAAALEAAPPHPSSEMEALAAEVTRLEAELQEQRARVDSQLKLQEEIRLREGQQATLAQRLRKANEELGSLQASRRSVEQLRKRAGEP